ncbi:MAG: NifB/NifX family molybdenum-iron cluster-binding protein [Thermoplasmata archaeon]|nr:MAG: NifB/NifX family molybdenum-iron cluster-binding protein [Thermoplasmata archaeon]
MRVTVPTTGDMGLEEEVNGHIGMAPTYTIVDTESGEVRTVENTSNHRGGVGMPPEVIARAGTDVVLCYTLGQRAIDLFRGFGIKVHIGAEGTVAEAIDAWKEGRLPEPDDHTDCGHGCGGH